MKTFTQKQLIYIVGAVIVLPLLIWGIYAVNVWRSQADTGCPATNVRSQRVSVSAGTVTFDTACEVKAEMQCSAGRGGVQFLCGPDETPTTHHVLSTSGVTLSSNVGYYTFIQTGVAERALGYIPASPTNPTYGLQFDDVDETTLGTSAGEPGFDPALDINQDGVISVLDKVEFY